MRSCFNYLPVYSNNALKKCVQSYGHIQFIIQNIKVNEPRILYLSSSHSVNIWALRTTIKFTFQINSYLDRRSYWCEEAITRSKKLWPLVRDIVPGEYYNKANIWHWNRAFTQWEGERDQTSGCQDNWQRHLDHTAGMTDWHSLPLIVFPPSLCHISLSPFLTFFPLCLCLCPHQPSHRHPVGHHAMPLCHCYPWHLRDKVTPDDWWPQVHAEMSSSL